MMVALVFTMLLMVGMASVFKASLSTFFTSGEITSSARRNRMSLDALKNDINTAAMYMVNLAAPPVTDPNFPPIYIQPNMPIVQINGTTTPPGTANPLDPTTSDQLMFYVDEPLPFEGKLQSVGAGGTPQQSANTLVQNGLAPAASDYTFNVDCAGNSNYAKMVKAGQSFIFKDNFEIGYLSADPSIAGSVVTLVNSASGTAGVTGQSNGSGLPSKFQHVAGAGVVFVLPAQMVVYQVKMLQLDMDPNKPNGIPCLVRDQYNYSDVVAAGGFPSTLVPTAPEQIITENVQALKIYMSCNAGQTWAGYGTVLAGWAGWSTATTGIRAQLDSQLSTTGRPGYTTTETTEQWFRSIPTLIRFDVTTRTAAQRTEYSTTPASTTPTAAFKQLTQSLVFVPRHSGLPMD
jgi:hypothetical protein